VIKRLQRIGVSFVAVIGLYWLYALAVVPWIEPNPQLAKASLHGTDYAGDVTPSTNPFHDLLAPYFPPGHWALDYPKVIRSEQALLVLEDWHPRENGLLQLDRCALIFFPHGGTNRLKPSRDAVILEAPRGAALQFDDLDLQRARLGQLQRGRLIGPITIRSDMQEEGPDDDLRITTSDDVFLSPTRIWTPTAVACRLGASTVVGRDMEIRLMAAPAAAGKTSGGLQVSGIRSFELKQDVRMSLVFASSNLLPTGKPSGPRLIPAQAAPPTAVPSQPAPPVRIRCQGPFHFDVARRIATFQDDVHVDRLRDKAAPDTLHCQALSVEFSQDRSRAIATGSANGTPAAGASMSMQPRLIVARGNPVRVTSPATESSARCQRLEYDVPTRRITLASDQETVLIQGANQLHAKSFQYQPSVRPRGIPQMESEGPGWLVAASRDHPSQRLTATWGRRMALTGHQGEPVLSMWGSPELAMEGTGSISGDELHLYLKETPGRTLGPNLPEVLPDRMQAMSSNAAARNVHVRSATFSAAVHEMRLWFVQRPRRPGTQGAAGAVGAPTDRTSNTAVQPSKVPGNSYLVGAELAQAEIAIGAGNPAVRNATLEGHVEIRQAASETPDQRPLFIRGGSLKISHADRPQMRVTILGKPAFVQARELTLQAGQIDLDRAANRLWVDVPGTMSLLVRRGLSGPARPAGQEMHITWQGGMDFNGQTVTFTRSVHAYDADSALNTESLSAVLTRPVRFDTPNRSPSRTRVEIGRITSPVPVTVERRGTARQRIVSRERMEIRNLLIDMVTGAVAAQGPGQVSTVRHRGQTNGIAPDRRAVAAARPVAIGSKGDRAAVKPSGLEYLRVDFQRAVDGNLHRRTLTFIGKVRATYGPVDQWDDRVDVDSPEGLGPDGVMSTSDRLTVREIRLADRDRGTVELEAEGNAVVEGRSFFARAQRMRYAQAKELIVLEGDRRTNAKLWQQETAGNTPARFAARQIFYWRREGRVRVADANSLTLPLRGTRPAAAQKRVPFAGPRGARGL